LDAIVGKSAPPMGVELLKDGLYFPINFHGTSYGRLVLPYPKSNGFGESGERIKFTRLKGRG